MATKPKQPGEGKENKVCCVDCGVNFLTEQQKKIPYPTTFHNGVCCICGKTKSVTSIRHYNNLQMKLTVQFKVVLKRLSTGNYLGYMGTHYFFAYRRPHGKWCCRIGKDGEWLWREGYHGTSLPTIKHVKTFIKSILILQ